jgi:hypothetical protein
MTAWDVFLSYARADAEIVHSCADALERAGLRTWKYLQPESLTLTRLPLKLAHALLETKVFCLFASQHSWASWPGDSRASRWVTEEYRMFAHRPWGIWSDNAEPSVIVVRLPGFTGSVSDLSRPPWSWVLQRSCPIYELSITDDAVERSLVDSVLGLVEVWRDASLMTPRHRMRKEYEDSLCQEGIDDLMINFNLKLLDELIPPTLPERVEIAQKYWRWTRPNRLADWDESVIPTVLEQFDRLYIPDDSGWTRPEDDDDELYSHIGEIQSIGASGYTLAALFSEAVACVAANRYPSVNASARVHEELSTLMPGILKRVGGADSFRFQMAVESTNAVQLLCNIGIEANILKTLQSAYYACRRYALVSESRDALDLTVLFSAGFMLDRWSLAGIRPDPIVRALVNGERLT